MLVLRIAEWGTNRMTVKEMRKAIKNFCEHYSGGTVEEPCENCPVAHLCIDYAFEGAPDELVATAYKLIFETQKKEESRMTDNGKQLIELLTQEGKKYGKYWIAQDNYSTDRKAWYLDGFLAALKIVQAYFDEEATTHD